MYKYRNQMIIIVMIVIMFKDINGELDINNHFAYQASAKPCSYYNTINITNGLKNFENDMILHNGINYTPDMYKEYTYVISASFKKIPVPRHIRGCVCNYKICIRVCCDPGFNYDDMTYECVENDQFRDFYVTIVQPDGNSSVVNLYNDPNYSYVVGKPCLGYFLEANEQRILNSDGTLNYIDVQYDIDDTYNHNTYCLDYRNQSNEYVISPLICDEGEVNLSLGGNINKYGMLISVPFLILTFIVYCWIHELRDTLPGKSLMCYVLMLATAYLTLGLVQLNGKTRTDSPLCKIHAYIIQGSFLASFVWLNVISFDIWWTFGKGKNPSRRRFLKYSTYAWSVTGLLLLWCILMDNLDGVPMHLKPNLGKDFCWLQKNHLVEFLYLYLPAIIVVTINSIFFGMTAYYIRVAQNATSAALTKGDSRKHSRVQADNEKFNLFLRLFIIMGVTWSMEIIAWALDRNKRTLVFILTDLCNAIQGVLIFILFICKRNVRQLIMLRFTKK